MDGLDKIELCPNEIETGKVNVLSGGRIGTWGPEKRLVERPGADGDNGNLRVLCGLHGFIKARLVIRPQLAALCIVDCDGAVLKKLVEAVERRDAIVRGVEEDVVAEL